jgi:S1-C subfamily serine protease
MANDRARRRAADRRRQCLTEALRGLKPPKTGRNAARAITHADVRTLQVSKSALTQIAALLAAAIAGGAIAVGGAALLLGVGDDDGGSSGGTVTEFASSTPDRFQRGKRLSLAEVYRQSEGGVVQVATTDVVESQDPFFGVPQQERRRGLGSGFVIDKSGHLVTNFHVIEGADQVEVSFSNGEKMNAEIVGRDPSTDVAVLRVDASARALRPLRLGDSDALEVGDEVVAIGNPLGYERTMTAGIVSALGRVIEAPNQFAIDEVIQTDAPINRGNSGGPLLNAEGQVVGVNTQIATAGSSGSIGIGFAVPINTVKDVAAQLIDKGRVEHSFLGVRTQEIDPDIADTFNLGVERGLLIASVTDGSAADKAGLRGGTEQVVVEGTTWTLGGDIILAADGVHLRTFDQLRELIDAKDPGDEVKLEIRRDGKTRTVTVKLGRRPTSPQG